MMTDYQLAKSITDLLPKNYKQVMTKSLVRLSQENDEWAFKGFMIMLYFALYPRKNDFWALHDLSYEEWRNRAKTLLAKLKDRSEKK